MLRGVSQVIDYIFSVLKVFLLFLFALFLPRFFLFNSDGSASHSKNSSSQFKLGLENLSESVVKQLKIVNNKPCSIGLITNQTGKDQQGNRNIDLLCEKGIKIKKIFTPQHGFTGTKNMQQAQLNSACDSKTNIPIVSLFGAHSAKKFNAKMLNDVDMLVFDIQDVGMRHYSYIITLLESLQAAQRFNKKIVVLDRPNLLGSSMEGFFSVLSKSQKTAYAPIPVRYGMTVGELARYFNMHILPQQAQLEVVPMKYYNRNVQMRDVLVSHLSPNIPTIESCYGYSFLGLLGEVAPFDIGVGTSKAFQCIALPDSVKISKQKWYELRTLLREAGVESKLYRYMSKRKKEYCTGLRLAITDINNISSCKLLISILDFFKDAGITLSFSSHFNKALGSTKVRDFFEGKINRAQLEYEVNENLKVFFNQASSSFLYRPFPKIVMV